MKKLKISGRPILNFYDLHNNFSPYELFAQIDLFTEFAEVHCQPLQAHVLGKPVDFMSKDFWLKLLRLEDWPQAKSLDDLFTTIFYSILDIDEEDDDTGEGDKFSEREIANANIMNKLNYIAENFGADFKNVIKILAICELAEVDVMTIEPSTWKNYNADEKNSGEIIDKISLKTTISLTPGARVYRFLYHDSEKLPEKATIRTVKIEAAKSLNQFAEVKIEIYSERRHECLHNFTLKQGEYIYCNSADDKVIKILPSYSRSEDFYLAREDYSKSEITVYPEGSESWKFNTDNVSSFAAGTKRDGFILVQDGRINHSFYEPAKDYFIRLKLDMISLPVVEAMINPDGYRILLSNGTVISRQSDAEAKNVISLSSEGRY